MTVINLLPLSSKFTLQYVLCNKGQNSFKHLSCRANMLIFVRRGHLRDTAGGRRYPPSSCVWAVGEHCGYGDIQWSSSPVLFSEAGSPLLTLHLILAQQLPSLALAYMMPQGFLPVKASCLLGTDSLGRSPAELACALRPYSLCMPMPPLADHPHPAHTTHQLWPVPNSHLLY